MSPKTTPSAASESAASVVPRGAPRRVDEHGGPGGDLTDGIAGSGTGAHGLTGSFGPRVGVDVGRRRLG